MRKTHAEFWMSVAAAGQLPAETLPEVAFLGRSNVGKSSLLNCLVGRRGLAQTSRTPGRTQTINFYRVESGLLLVDLPGYGFAKAPAAVAERWRRAIDHYLHNRESLALCVVLLDARRGWMALDLELKDWLEHYRRPYQVVATKVDKLNRKELTRGMAEISRQSGGREPIAFSALDGRGTQEIWKSISQTKRRQDSE